MLLFKIESKEPKTETAYKTAPNGGTAKKYIIQGDIRALLGKNCEVEKMMRFLKETEV